MNAQEYLIGVGWLAGRWARSLRAPLRGAARRPGAAAGGRWTRNR